MGGIVEEDGDGSRHLSIGVRLGYRNWRGEKTRGQIRKRCRMLYTVTVTAKTCRSQDLWVSVLLEGGEGGALKGRIRYSSIRWHTPHLPAILPKLCR